MNIDMDIFTVKVIQLEGYWEVLFDNADGGDESLEYDTMIMLRDSIKKDAEEIGFTVKEEQLYSLDYIAGMLHAYKTVEKRVK